MPALDTSKIIGVIGAGTMGAGIAQVAAAAGHPVLLFDIGDGAVERGIAGIAKALESGDASATQPYDFLRLPLTAGCAFILFDEILDIWTWAGAAVIFGSSYALVRFEARREAK